MARFQFVPAPAHAEVYHLNGRLAPIARSGVVHPSEAVTAAVGALLFGAVGALAGALLHI